MPSHNLQALTIIVLPEGNVRMTPDKRVSIFDAIRVGTDAKNPHQVWNNLKKRYPEVLQKVENFKFPGRGERSTPVAQKQVFLEILGLLPGETAKKFREESVHLVLRYIEGDATLAEEMIDRQEDPDVLERLATRAKGKQARSLMTRTIQAHGGESGPYQNTYRAVSSMFNKAVMQHPSKDIQQYTGERNTRDGLPSLHLAMLMTGEQLFTHLVTHQQVYGHQDLVKASGNVAQTLADLCRQYGVPPFPPSQEV